MGNRDINTIFDLLDKVRTYNNNKKDLANIQKCYEYAYEKHFGQKRITGDDYIIHPLNVAYILTDTHADTITIMASLLHDTVEDSDATLEEITNLFGKEVSSIVDGVTKINKINFSTTNEQMVANQRKILVSLVSDVRVIIIKLSDRLHNMRTLYVLPEEKQKRKAKETLEILAPVAHRLGIAKIKSELEDLSLRYLNPDAYYDVVEKLNLKKSERDAAVNNMLKELSNMLNEHNIKHDIKGRSKSIYSIYKKLSTGRPFSDIYDLLALRIFVKTEQECYLVLGLIHSKYRPVPKRFKDFIAMPKTNMYQSLHTTIFGIDGELFEVQIRTYDMDKIAEYGIASHWSYKEKKDGAKIEKDAFEQKLQIFRSIIELNQEDTSNEQFMNDIQNDILTSDSIFVYTPKGDVIELPKDATPVDFAYRVHSEIGNKVTGALVNDTIVSLDYHLQSGDIVKINTSNSAKGPNKEWLNFVVTAQARNAIKSFYNKLDRVELIDLGEEIIQKELRKKNLPFAEVFSDTNINIILNKLKLKDIDELYFNFGTNKYNIQNLDFLFKEEVKEEPKIASPLINNTKNDILVEGEGDIKVTLSSCCNPVKGDSIIGYVTTSRGITIHRTNCQNISSDHERIIQVNWNEQTNNKYLTDIIIYSSSIDLSDIVSHSLLCNIQIYSIITLNNNGKEVIFKATLRVSDLEDLNKYLISLNNLKYISKVERFMN